MSFVLAACAVVAGAAEPPTQPHAETWANLVRDLDADQYETRSLAAGQLEQFGRQPELRQPLADHLYRSLLAPGISFEVRSRLDTLLSELPPPRPVAPIEISPDEIDRLLVDLDDDSYGVRRGASVRLRWLLRQPELTSRVMLRAKAALVDEGLSAQLRREIERQWTRARSAWLLTDPARWVLPPVSPQQIDRWLDDLVGPVPPHAEHETWRADEVSRRELMDVLVRDEYLTTVTAAMTVRLDDESLDPDGRRRLDELYGWTRPAMAAEYWQAGSHLHTQRLLVDVPQQVDGAQRPTHFDQMDDDVAHCASGNTLEPGNYPVGVAIAHPTRDRAWFQLVNLPTPRRRLAYEHYLELDERLRLRDLSQRTLDYHLRSGRPLELPDLAILELLDANAVSRFAGKYFMAVDDVNFPPDGLPRHAGPTSLHQSICLVLAQSGTREVVPGLLQAIAAERFLPPTTDAPYALPWIAALAIASRDPWKDVDGWLLELSPKPVPLVRLDDEEKPDPQLGATAAALLLKRHEVAPSYFGLRPSDDYLLTNLGCPGYWYPEPDTHEAVARWWTEHEQEQVARLVDP